MNAADTTADSTLSPACPRCGQPLPPGTSPSQCPACLLALAADTDSGATKGAAVPTPRELQPLFPSHEIQLLLGRGGMGAVYRARDIKLDRLVAIKVLLPELSRDPAFAERFEREARALAVLDHPNIVGIHDFGRAGELFYLTMAYVDGASLRDLLAQGRLTARDVLALVPQLCDALQYAHDHGVVHRDIKPENVLVDADGRVRIGDFGLAKLVEPEASGLGLTQTAQGLGTPHYMAPEQIHAAGRVDHRADLYSLGVVLYEMLTGELPLGRFAPPSAKVRHAEAFDPVVMKSLENDPAQRYQAAAEVKRDVEAASVAGEGPQEGAATARELRERRKEQRQRSKRPLLSAWLAFTGVLIASGMVWFSTGSAHNFGSGVFSGYDRIEILIALGVVVLAAARAMDIDTGKKLVVGTALGVAYILVNLVLAAANNIAVGPGLVLCLLVFALWLFSEVRYLGRPAFRWRRARLRDGTPASEGRG